MEYIVIAVLIAGAFVVGFFVGGKHKERVMKAAWSLKDTVGRM